MKNANIPIQSFKIIVLAAFKFWTLLIVPVYANSEQSPEIILHNYLLQHDNDSLSYNIALTPRLQHALKNEDTTHNGVNSITCLQDIMIKPQYKTIIKTPSIVIIERRSEEYPPVAAYRMKLHNKIWKIDGIKCLPDGRPSLNMH